MEIKEIGRPSFTHLQVDMEPGDSIVTEAGAMASQDPGVDLTTSLKGGFLSSLLRRFLGGESLFINTFKNKAQKKQSLILSKETPGDMICRELNNESLYLQPRSFIACTEGVELKISWAGFRYLIGGEGLFRLAVKGTGKVWIGVFGAIVERDLQGELIVDTGHLVAYSPDVAYKLQLSGGLISSMTSGEGFVGRLEGNGKVYLQTRSLAGLVGWLNPRLPG